MSATEDEKLRIQQVVKDCLLRILTQTIVSIAKDKYQFPLNRIDVYKLPSECKLHAEVSNLFGLNKLEIQIDNKRILVDITELDELLQTYKQINYEMILLSAIPIDQIIQGIRDTITEIIAVFRATDEPNKKIETSNLTTNTIRTSCTMKLKTLAKILQTIDKISEEAARNFL